MNTDAKIIVYGNYIAQQHIENQHNYFGEEKVHPASKAADPLTAKALEPYLRAGLVTPDLMPAPGLASGEIALLAHDIGVRLKMRAYWPYFKQKWGNNCDRRVYSRALAKPETVPFLKRLSAV